MKYVMLAFMIFVSLSAFTANSEKKINQMTTKPANQEATQLDDLVRGELAALKAYDQVLADTKDEKQKAKLMMIRKDHEKAVSTLSRYVAGKPAILEDTEEAGPWGNFAKIWVKGRGIAGNEGAMKALGQGEKHGIKEYKEALDDKSLNNELKEMIKTEMIPAQEKHLEMLKTIM